MIITTQSGSVYEFIDNFTKMRRANSVDKLRQDGEWIQVYGVYKLPQIGESLVVFLEQLNPLFPAGTTIRQTTPVTGIILDPEEQE